MANENYTVQDLQDNLNYLNETKGIIKNAIIAKGQTIENSDTFRSYAEKISAIETGTGVKLFKTEKEMQADPKAKEGDLAVVYDSKIQNMTADLEVTALTFPEKVTLPAAFTDSVFCSIRAVDSSVMFDGNCELSQTSFRFDSWTESGMIRAEYTSEDGITYNRTRFQGDSGDLTNPVEVPACKVERAEEWNDNIGYFLQTGGMNFEGLFEYGRSVDSSKINFANINSLVFGGDNLGDYDATATEFTTLTVTQDLIDLIRNKVSMSDWNWGQVTVWFQDKNTLRIAGYIIGMTNCPMRAYFDKNKSFLGISNTSHSTTATLNYADINLTNMTISTGTLSANKDGVFECGLTLPNLCTISAKEFKASETCDSSYFFTLNYNAGIKYSYNYTSYKYQIAPNQFNLASSNQLLPGKTAYGKNGVVTGDDGIYDNLNWSQIWSKYNLSQTNAYDIRDINATTPIITYNPNNEGKSYINASELINESQNVVTSLTDTGVSRINTFVEIEKGTILYFGSKPSSNKMNVIRYKLQDNVVYIDLYDEFKIDTPIGYFDYAKYNPTDKCVYLLKGTSSTLLLYTYNIDTKVLTEKFSINGDYRYMTPNFCFDSSTLFIDSSSAEGFYRFTFSGTRTTIQSHRGYSSVVPISDTYIAVKDGSNGRAKLYNMKTEQWTSITTEQQSIFILCDAPDSSTYLLENTTLRKIQNDKVVKTTNIDFTNSSRTKLDQYSSNSICLVDKIPTYKTYMIIKGLYIDTDTDIAYVDDTIPESILVLYKNKRNICTILGVVFKNVFIDVLTDGTGKYVAMNDGTHTTKYIITKAQEAKLKKDFELTDYSNTISPEEYSTAIDTADKILGGVTTKTVQKVITDNNVIKQGLTAIPGDFVTSVAAANPDIVNNVSWSYYVSVNYDENGPHPVIANPLKGHKIYDFGYFSFTVDADNTAESNQINNSLYLVTDTEVDKLVGSGELLVTIDVNDTQYSGLTMRFNYYDYNGKRFWFGNNYSISFPEDLSTVTKISANSQMM